MDTSCEDVLPLVARLFPGSTPSQLVDKDETRLLKSTFLRAHHDDETKEGRLLSSSMNRKGKTTPFKRHVDETIDILYQQDRNNPLVVGSTADNWRTKAAAATSVIEKSGHDTTEQLPVETLPPKSSSWVLLPSLPIPKQSSVTMTPSCVIPTVPHGSQRSSCSSIRRSSPVLVDSSRFHSLIYYTKKSVSLIIINFN